MNNIGVIGGADGTTQIEDSARAGDGLAQLGERPDQRLLEGRGGGLARLVFRKPALGAEVDDVARDGQPHGGGKRIGALRDGLGQRGQELAGQPVEALFRVAVRVRTAGDLVKLRLERAGKLGGRLVEIERRAGEQQLAHRHDLSLGRAPAEADGIGGLAQQAGQTVERRFHRGSGWVAMNLACARAHSAPSCQTSASRLWSGCAACR